MILEGFEGVAKVDSELLNRIHAIDSPELQKRRYGQIRSYDQMRKIRDGLRAGLERNLLGILLGADIPEKTISEIFNEDVFLHSRILMRMCDGKKSSEKKRIKDRYLSENDPATIKREVMWRNQKARYIGEKIYGLIREGKYNAARLLYDDASNEPVYMEERMAIRNVGTIYVIDEILTCFDSGQYTKIADMVRLFRDLCDFKKSDFNEIIKSDFAVRKACMDAIDQGVAEWPSTRDYFVELGLLKRVDTISKEDRGGVVLPFRKKDTPPVA